VKDHGYLCSAEGVALIKADIEGEGVNTVAIAACSPRVKFDVFDFGPDVMVERINLREQVVWCHEPGDEDTQMLAEDNIRMGMVRANQAELPTPYLGENLSKTVLVVGGGLAGMTAALETAKAGYPVVLVEKEATLGGWLNKIYKAAPLKAPYDELVEPGAGALAGEIAANPNIKVYTGATIEKTAGGPGMFDVTINAGGTTVEERIGSIIVATGAKPYDTEKVKTLPNLGFGTSPDIVTNVMFEELAQKGNGKILRPSDGKEVQSVAFIQCAGSRDKEHLPYCSAACCIESLKQALYVKEQNPEASVYIFFKDIRSSGQYEHFYKRVQSEGVVFIKGDVTCVSDEGGTFAVEADDILLGDKASAQELDMVVLATGMVTSYAPEESAESLGEAAAEAAPAAEGQPPAAPAIPKLNILNLEYRQGPEMPALKYGFPDSHFICFPYETRRTGIYAAGSVRKPMDLPTTIEDATGAALKAIQCVESTARGAAVHPRSGDLSFPEFNMNRCTQCKRCTEECPFGAINEDAKANPLPNPTRCRRCATCMGACPERIISFKNYSVPMIGNMIKAIEVPEEDEEKPRILVFACENDAYPALDMAGINRMKYNAWVRVIPVRCLGSLNLVWVADAMSKGIDGVLLMGCKHGDDYQCHYVKGSELAEIRLSKVSETLDRLGLESERVRATTVNIMDYEKIPAMLDEFAARLDELGPNPMKGF
ncbi:MAG: hydrogenase iron-sulfur subunit, partial [Firmicutes bacterium]|nr:hydrogenase iron-sulfur subunit [Bacillota bacterium]